MDFDYGPYEQALGQYLSIEAGGRDDGGGVVVLRGRLKPVGPAGEAVPELSFTALCRSVEALVGRVTELGWQLYAHPDVQFGGSLKPLHGQPNNLVTIADVTLLIERPANLRPSWD